MHELPSDPDDVLALARRAQGEPDAEVRSRVRRGVTGALLAGTAVSLASVAEARAAIKGGWSAALMTKLALGAAVCAVALGLVLRPSSHPTSQAEPRAPTPVASEPVATEPAAAVPLVRDANTPVGVPQPSQTAPAVAAAVEPRVLPVRRSRAAQVATTPSLRAELALLEQAERAIDEHDPARALALLARHRARFASSSFAQEREGLSLIARCLQGSAASAADATRFLAQAGGGTLHDRVRTACAGPR